VYISFIMLTACNYDLHFNFSYLNSHPTSPHSTLLNLSALHFFTFNLYLITLHFTCRHFIFSHLTPPNYTLHYTSLFVSTPHFFQFQLHPITHLITLPYFFRHFTSYRLNFTQLHTSLHFTTLVDTSFLPI
jgi:hypothetical protein